MADPASETQHSAPALFPNTHWSAIVAARDTDTPVAQVALERLAKAYWRPLYHFLRQRGANHDRAADQVQGFFAYMLSRDFLRELRPSDGRFRNFLLVALRRWVRDQADREHAGKRGGGQILLPLDELAALRLEPSDTEATPEVAFDRRWAQELVERSLHQLAQGWTERAALFEALRLSLEGGPDAENYADTATKLGMTEGAVKKAAFDLRRQFSAQIREEIRSTVQDEREATDELRYLVELLRR